MDVVIALLTIVVGLAFHRILALERSVKALSRRLDAQAPPAELAHTPASTERSPAIDDVYTPRPDLPSVATGAQVRRSPQPAQTPTPSAAHRARARVTGYFTGGNVVVRVGAIVLFFGVAFGLRYANEQGVFDVPIEARFSAALLLAAILVGIGWQLRHRSRGYGLILQGTGVGIAYLTVFAAMQFFNILPALPSFVFLVMLVALAATLAVGQDSASLAVVAIIGGFLAPLLTSTGEGSPITAFSYYLVLNGGVLGMAWFRSWRALNVSGFVLTFVVATVWGVADYTPNDQPPAQVFLILFFVFYVAIAVLYAARQPVRLRGVVDATLVFGVPIAIFGLQASLVSDTTYGVATSALVLGVFYATAWGVCHWFGGPAYRLLRQAFVALALIFGSLAILFAYSEEIVVASWALEGAAVLWCGLRQRSTLTIVSALALQVLAGLLYLPVALFDRCTEHAFGNTVFMSGTVVALVGVLSGWLIHRAVVAQGYRPLWLRLSRALSAWGLLWWLGNGLAEISTHVEQSFIAVWALVFIGISAGALGALEVFARWPQWRFTAAGLLTVMVVTVPLVSVGREQPFEDGLLWGWLCAFSVLYALLALRDRRGDLSPVSLKIMHTGAWWLASYLCIVEATWAAHQWAPWQGAEWSTMGGPVMAVALIGVAMAAPVWPMAWHRQTYVEWGSAPLVLGAAIWSVVVGSSLSGDFDPLPYLPLVNPLDVVSLAVLIAVWEWAHRLPHAKGRGGPQRYVATIWCMAAFTWLTALILRTIAAWTDVRYLPHALWTSDLAQSGVSILWTVIALTAMVLATRRQWRQVWLVAMTILSLVVLKLFVVDTRGADTVSTIVAFIAVGILLLIAGYVSPLPPKKGAALAGTQS